MAPPTMENEVEFEDPRIRPFAPQSKLGRVVRACLWADFALAILATVTAALIFLTFHREVSPEAGLALGLIGTARMTFGVITAILFTAWAYRTHRNLNALGAMELDLHAWWVIVGFFFPFANLVHGYQVIRETWKASDPETDLVEGTEWKDNPLDPSVPWWWGLFLGGNFAGLMTHAPVQPVGNASDVTGVLELIFLSSVCMAAAALLGACIVRDVDERQRARYERIQSFPLLDELHAEHATVQEADDGTDGQGDSC